MSSTDQIRKQVLLRAPRTRVWDAITDADKFGTWFGVEFDDPFLSGARVRGRVVPTKVDADVAKEQEPYRGVEFDVLVDRIDSTRETPRPGYGTLEQSFREQGQQRIRLWPGFAAGFRF